MKKKRLSACIALIATFSQLATTVSAANWNLDAGNISIEHNGTTQTVTQNGTTQEDNDIVITQSDPSITTENTIKVSTTDDSTAKFTISNVNMSNYSESLIDIGSSNAEITLDGENHLKQYNYSDKALIHVSDGSLTINGNGSLELNTDTEGALIGSNYDEDMSGNITITGNTDISAYENSEGTGQGDGAGIGSGYGGDFTGSVAINGNATIEIEVSSDGAGIGSGMNGTNRGDIVIEGDADVDLWVDDDGAGIGSGDESDFEGTITIGGNAVVNAVSDDQGAGIGAGEDGSFKGALTIKDNARVYAESGDDASGIGGGEHGNFSGSVTIKDNAYVDAFSEDEGAGIGAGQEGVFDGTISIEGDAEVHAESDCCGAGIGAGENGSFDGTLTIGDNAKVYAESYNYGTGIGAGEYGSFTGSVTIGDNSKVHAESYSGNAIGSGNSGNFTGDVTIKDNAYVYLSSDYSDIGGYSSYDDYEFQATGTVNILDESTVKSEYDTFYLGYYDDEANFLNNEISMKISDHATINGYTADKFTDEIVYMDYNNYEIIETIEKEYPDVMPVYMAPADSSVKFTITDTAAGETYSVDANNISKILAKVTDGAEITINAGNTQLVLDTDTVNEIIASDLTVKVETSKGTFIINADNLAAVKTINLASIMKTDEFKALDKEADEFKVIVTEKNTVVIEKA